MFAAIAAVVIGVAVAASSHQRRQLRTAMTRVAQELYGEVSATGQPVLRLHHAGVNAEIEVQGKGWRGHSVATQFSTDWPDRELRVTVVERGLFSWLSRSTADPRVRIDSGLFTPYFLAYSNDPAKSIVILGTHVQARLLTLRRLGFAGVELRLRNGRLTVSKRGRLDQVGMLRTFAANCLQLIEESLSVAGDGVEVEGVRVDYTEANCPVCGEGLSGSIVRCTHCHTPHHSDCWHYFGGCALFGCGHSRKAKR